MPRGAPDFGMYAVTEVIASMADSGELAARLGSPDVFDRRGNVVFIDSFGNDLIPYHKVEQGTGASVSVVTDYSRTGAFSCKMVGGSDADSFARLQKWVSYPALTKWGFEIGFTYNEDVEHYDFLIILVDGTDWYYMEIALVPADDALYYLDQAEARQPIATNLGLYSTHYLFNFIKLVADLDSKKFVRVILNETEYPLDTISLRTGVAAAGHFLLARIEVVSPLLSNELAYIDEFIITQNEP